MNVFLQWPISTKGGPYVPKLGCFSICAYLWGCYKYQLFVGGLIEGLGTDGIPAIVLI